MKFPRLVLTAALLAGLAAPARAANKDMERLYVQIAALQGQIADMQRASEESLKEIRRLNEVLGDDGPVGCEYHCCFGTDGNLKVSEVWESQEKLEAFGKTLMPILADVGIDPGQPEILPVHNTLPAENSQR